MSEQRSEELAGVVLAAGAGTRLRPLTTVRPKALCTVDRRPLLDWALERLRPYVAATAVNVHHHRDQMLGWLTGGDVHVSVEVDEALGTAGGLGHLRPWVDGRPVLLTNADAWHPPGAGPVISELVAGWDGARPRLLCAPRPGGVFDGLEYVGTAVLPWWSVRDLAAQPAGLYEVSWRELYGEGRLDLVATEVDVVDCGTPRDYLRANLTAAGGRPVVEDGARVEGELVRSVVWAGETVGRDELLVDAIRAAGTTLQPFATTPATSGQ